MGRETSPAFQLYVKEWRSSRSIARMTFAQRGMYLEMLLEQWDAGDLPDDSDAVADLLGGRPNDWRRNWTVLRRKFETSDHGRIQNARLEIERLKQRKWRKKAQKGGFERAKRLNSTAKQTSKQGTSTATGLHCVSDRISVSDRVSVSSPDTPFDTFWRRYPNRTGKQAALKAWGRINPDDALIGLINSALDWQSKQPNWTKDGGRFVPHASTWLNGRRWEDEPFNPPQSNEDPNAEVWGRVLEKVSNGDR